MNINDLETVINTAGYEVKRATSTRLIVYTQDDRKTVLRDIATITQSNYTTSRTGSGWKSSVGATLVGNIVVLAKPITKGITGNIASLDARVFTTLGTKTKFNYAGADIDAVKFTSADTLKQSILIGMKNSDLLGDAYKEMFDNFFSDGKIDWGPDAPQAVVSKLGVYVGEVLIGWAALAKKQNQYFQSNPFSGTAKAFYIPTDPSFSGVDSFLEMQDNSYYSISSKFGRGAKASIFTNLLKVGIQKEGTLKASVFKDLCKVAKSNNLKYTSSKSIVYAYGVRNILGIKSNVVANPDTVYTQAYTNAKGKEVASVVSAILMQSPSDDIKNKLPSSISSFFTRTIAERLNNDPESLNQIEEILTGKEYWQANLDIAAWKRGDVSFSFVKSSKATIKIFGNKSAIGDITAKQGWINYELS